MCKRTSVCLYLKLFTLAIPVQSWCYNGCEESPSYWPALPSSQCGGVSQSPINIDTTQLTSDPTLHTLTFSDMSHPFIIKSLVNNGHTVSCELEQARVEVIGGGLPQSYRAAVMHFHWGRGSPWHPGSEHTVDSVRYPMEMHLVALKQGLTMDQAKTESSGIAVFGFFIDVTEDPVHDNAWKTLTSYLSNITETDSTVNMKHPLSLRDLLGSLDLTKFYRYQGSLTTPGCEEAVVWTVFQEPIKMGRDLVRLFPETLRYRDTYRPPQNLHGRPVYASPGVTAPQGGGTNDGCTLGALFFCLHILTFLLLLCLDGTGED